MIDDDDMHRNVCRDLHIKVKILRRYFPQNYSNHHALHTIFILQRHHLYCLRLYISILESRKIIIIPEESIAKLQHRTVVQGTKLFITMTLNQLHFVQCHKSVGTTSAGITCRSLDDVYADLPTEIQVSFVHLTGVFTLNFTRR